MVSQGTDYSGNAMWQRRLLPLMAGMLVGLTFFFFIASFIQLYYLHHRIEQAPNLDLNAILKLSEKPTESALKKETLELMRLKTLALLEEHALKRRYHQANVLLMSRTWTRYLGFVTGMILALVGAAFIVGKLREPESKLNAEGVWKFSITTASPGLILALLGTILMLVTMVTHHEIETKDKPAYVELWWRSPETEEAGQVIPEKPDLDRLEKQLKDLKKMK
jgi:hypothetical protein